MWEEIQTLAKEQLKIDLDVNKSWEYHMFEITFRFRKIPPRELRRKWRTFALLAFFMVHSSKKSLHFVFLKHSIRLGSAFMIKIVLSKTGAALLSLFFTPPDKSVNFLLSSLSCGKLVVKCNAKLKKPQFSSLLNKTLIFLSIFLKS